MQTKLEIVGLIGLELVLTNLDDRLKRSVARMDIPDSDVAMVAYHTALRAFHQGLVTPELWDVAHVIVEQPRPKPQHLVGGAEMQHSG